jgi:hypothetical protein
MKAGPVCERGGCEGSLGQTEVVRKPAWRTGADAMAEGCRRAGRTRPRIRCPRRSMRRAGRQHECKTESGDPEDRLVERHPISRWLEARFAVCRRRPLSGAPARVASTTR